MAKKTITHAIWWPDEGEYGGGTTCKDMATAFDLCRNSHKMGYGKKKTRGRSEIHVHVKTVQIWVYDPETDSLVKRDKKSS